MTVTEIIAEVLNPEVALVKRGGSVLFVNMDNKAHRLVSGEPDSAAIGTVFDSDVILGAPGFQPFTQFSVAFTGDDVPFHCTLHPVSERGTIRVAP